LGRNPKKTKKYTYFFYFFLARSTGMTIIKFVSQKMNLMRVRMNKTNQTSELSANLSRVLQQLVTEGLMIYAYHWDPPELYLYLGEDKPYHIKVNNMVMEHANDSAFLKEWIKRKMWQPTLK
jgi:hypothetical protein